MRNLGIVRRIDELGRIVIPKEVRRSLGWESGTPMEMNVEHETLIISEYKIKCALCGNEDDLADFMNKKVCTTCISKIRNS